MKKTSYLVLIALLLIGAYFIPKGYSLLSTTFTDLFAVGNDGSGGPYFRIASDGGIITAGANTLSGTTTLSGNITISAGQKIGYHVASDSITLTTSSADIIFSSKTTGGARLSITLPAATNNGGLKFTIKKASIAAGITTIIPASGEMIDNTGGNNVEIDAVKDTLTLISDNSNWSVIQRYIQ